MSDPKETRDKSHSVPVAPPSTSQQVPSLNLSSPGVPLPFPSPSLWSIHNSNILTMCSLGPLGPLSPLSSPPLLSPCPHTAPLLLWPGQMVYSVGHVQSEAFQIPSAVLSLIATINPSQPYLRAAMSSFHLGDY